MRRDSMPAKPEYQRLKKWLSKLIKPQGTLWRLLAGVSHLPARLRLTLKRLYRAITKSSIFFEEEELPACSLKHPKKLDMALDLFKPRSVLDLGCGTGRSLDYLLDRGIDVIGVEGSSLAISRASHSERIQKLDLNHEVRLHRRFDLTWCVEVVEHIHQKYVRNLMRALTSHSNLVVLSAAPPGQGGEGHFNEQPPEYWIAMFKEYGFQYDESNTRKLRSVEEAFAENMLVFSRRAV